MKAPTVIINFSDELARQLTADVVSNKIQQFIKNEACTDIKGAAALLGYSESETRKHAKRWPCVELGFGPRGNRYRIRDIIAYRDKNTTHPK